MKRFWLGAAVMALLLGLGIAVTLGTESICAPISEQLEQASQTDDWEQAKIFSSQARIQWERSRRCLAAVTDHEPMEQIDSLFRSLEVYAQSWDTVRFSDTCAQLASQTQALAEAQAVGWWHIL